MQHINKIKQELRCGFYATAHPAVFKFEVCNMFSFHSRHYTFIVIFF